MLRGFGELLRGDLGGMLWGGGLGEGIRGTLEGGLRRDAGGGNLGGHPGGCCGVRGLGGILKRDLESNAGGA